MNTKIKRWKLHDGPLNEHNQFDIPTIKVSEASLNGLKVASVLFIVFMMSGFFISIYNQEDERTKSPVLKTNIDETYGMLFFGIGLLLMYFVVMILRYYHL